MRHRKKAPNRVVLAVFLIAWFVLLLTGCQTAKDEWIHSGGAAFPSSLDLREVRPSGTVDVLPTEFIALSESAMTWSDAVAYCQQQGGRLPLITSGTQIEGFGERGAPWPSSLPLDASYWTGTIRADYPDYTWVVRFANYSPFSRNISILPSVVNGKFAIVIQPKVDAVIVHQESYQHVVCVSY